MVGRQIAIIGSSPGKERAPFDDPSWECWCLNNLFLGIDGKKCSRWYELHVFEKTKKGYLRRGEKHYGRFKIEDYMKEIASLDIPVFMQRKWRIIPKSEKFPFKAITAQFGKYFGCSFAWMIAHALYEHLMGDRVSKIGFWGVNLAGVEYFRQRPSTEYFMGVAVGMGIDVFVDAKSDLLKMPYMYALKEDFRCIKKLYVTEGRDIARKFLISLQQDIESRVYGKH